MPRNLKILLVEDSLQKSGEATQLIKSVVEHLNPEFDLAHSIKDAPNFDAALDALKDTYQLIFLDFLLGNTTHTGFDLARIIRGDKNYERILKRRDINPENKTAYLVGLHQNWCGGRDAVGIHLIYRSFINNSINPLIENNFSRYKEVIRYALEGIT